MRTNEIEKKVKKPPNAYMIFCSEMRSRICELEPGHSNTSVMQRLGEMWKNMGVEQKTPYIEKANHILHQFKAKNLKLKYSKKKKKMIPTIEHPSYPIPSLSPDDFDYLFQQGIYFIKNSLSDPDIDKDFHNRTRLLLIEHENRFNMNNNARQLNENEERIAKTAEIPNSMNVLQAPEVKEALGILKDPQIHRAFMILMQPEVQQTLQYVQPSIEQTMRLNSENRIPEMPTFMFPPQKMNENDDPMHPRPQFMPFPRGMTNPHNRMPSMPPFPGHY